MTVLHLGTPPIRVVPVPKTGKLCVAFVWEITDRKRLVEVLARLATGQHLALTRVLTGLEQPIARPHQKAVEAARRKLRLGKNGDPWQRDGWVFQLIGWVAAHASAADGDVIRAPQPRKADKGFDGLIVRQKRAGGRQPGLVICEQKATDNARSKVQSQILPEFIRHEASERDDELLSEITTLLSQFGSDEAITIAERTLWEHDRQYQAAVTVSEPHRTTSPVSKLFKGYSVSVKGRRYRREAATLELADIRGWMSDFCSDLDSELERLLDDDEDDDV